MASRVTADTLAFYARLASLACGLDPEAIWTQRSATGVAVLRRDGAGARPLGECLTPREALNLLKGVQAGAELFSQYAHQVLTK